MNERTRFLAIGAVVVVLAAAAGYATYRSSSDDTARQQAVTQLTANSLSDLAGNPRRLAEWKGKVIVANFWATWCEPCREEMPGLMRIQSKLGGSGLAIVGIAVDSADKVQAFSKQYGINYPLLLSGLETVGLLRNLGNEAGGLPFTLVLDRAGTLVGTHLGRISEEQLEQIVKPLL